MVKRTKKTFTDYNQYKDRPFGLKWATAYAMDDLMKGILENEAWATKEVVGLDLMNREEIDAILSESFLYHKPISLQLNTKDEFKRFWILSKDNFLVKHMKIILYSMNKRSIGQMSDMYP